MAFRASPANGGISIEGGLGKVLDTTILHNTGTAIWTRGGIGMRSGAVFHNAAGATFLDQNPGDHGMGGAEGSYFQNDGEYIKSTNTITQFSGGFRNDNIVRVDAGALVLLTESTSSGSFLGAAGTTLEFQGQLSPKLRASTATMFSSTVITQ